MVSFLINFLRKLRHETFLKNFNFLWIRLGIFYRFLFIILGSPFSIKIKINELGPYKFDGYFAFSNFNVWGKKNNFYFTDFVNCCKNKKCILDVGAHIGLMSIPSSFYLNKSGKIFCFEPSKINKKYLIKHINLNKINNIEVYNYFVSNKNDSKVTFYEKEIPSGLNSALVIKNKKSFTNSVVETITLDSFVNNKKLKPDVIKIDVEGYEYFVIEGARQLIKKFKPIIFLSVHPNHLKEFNILTADLLKLFTELNYKSKRCSFNDKNELIFSPK